MPIRTTKIGRQRTVAGLAKALFDTGGSAALQERAEAALLRANPQLAEEGGIKSGNTIIVPSVRGVPPKEAAAPAVASPSPPPAEPDAAPAPADGGGAGPDPVVALARERVTALGRVGGQSTEAALAEAKRTVRELKSEKLAAALLAARPDYKDRLDAVRKEADQQVKRITEAGKQLRKVTALALEDLAALGDAPKPER